MKNNPTNAIMLRDYPNHSFSRADKKLYRTVRGSYIPIRKDGLGRFIIKKNSKPHMYTEDELMRLTDYAGRSGMVSNVKGVKGG